MGEPITDLILSTMIKTAVSKAAGSTFKLLGETFKGSDAEVKIDDDTRTSLQMYYERLVMTLRPVRLFHFNDTRWLDQIYVSLKIHRERTNPFRGWDPDELEAYIRKLDQQEYITREELLARTSKRYDDTAVLTAGKKLVIVGKPGSGKTTFLKHLSVSYIWGQVPELAEELGLLPIFVYFRELSRRPEDMLTVLTEQIKDLSLKPDTETFLHSCLDAGLCLLMLDGLDEVSDRDAYDKVISDLKRLCKQYPDNRILLTSRPTGYFNQLREEEFLTVEIEDMTPEQARQFSQGWFVPDASRPEETAKVLKQGFDQLLEESSIQSLATSPLMLSLLALLYEFELDLPKQRTQLFRNCTDALLIKWDASRGFQRRTHYEQLDNWHKKQLFYQIAKKLQIEERRLIEDRYLSLEIEKFFTTEGISVGDPEGVIQELEEHHGIIVEHAPHYYAFYHLGLQEYFTAGYYFSEPDDKEILAHITDRTWEEVLTFYANMVRADRLVDALLDSDSDRKHQMIYTWLKQGIRLCPAKRVNLLKWLNTGDDLSDIYADVPMLIAALPELQLGEFEQNYLEKIEQMSPSYTLVRELVTLVAIGLKSPLPRRKRYIQTLQKVHDQTLNDVNSILGTEISITISQFSQQESAHFFSALALALSKAQELVLARELSQDLSQAQEEARELALTRDQEVAQDQTFVQELVLARSRAQDRALARKWDQEWDQKQARSRERALARSLARARALDQERERATSNPILQKCLEHVDHIFTESSNDTWLEDLLNLSQNIADGIHAAQIAAEGIEKLQALNV